MNHPQDCLDCLRRLTRSYRWKRWVPWVGRVARYDLEHAYRVVSGYAVHGDVDDDLRGEMLRVLDECLKVLLT